MHARGDGIAVGLAGAILLLSAVGCLWKSYEEIMSVHLEVISSLSAKAVENAEAGQRPIPDDVKELTYPLQRGRQFAYQSRSNADRDSYRSFVAALDLYESFVDAIDAARGDDDRWAALVPTLRARRQRLLEGVREVRAALERER